MQHGKSNYETVLLVWRCVKLKERGKEKKINNNTDWEGNATERKLLSNG